MKNLVGRGVWSFGPRTVRGLMWAALSTSLAAGVCPSAFAQSQEPLDVNAVQPEPAPKTDAPAPAADAAHKAPPGPNATAEYDGNRYTVTRFVLEYKSHHPVRVPLEVLADTVVTLGVTPDGYVEPREGMPTVEMRIGDVIEGAGGSFYWSGLSVVASGIVRTMTEQGYIGQYAEFHPEDVDENSGEDLRAGKRSEMRIRIWTGKASMVRTIASGERLESTMKDDPALRLNHPDSVHQRIRDQSPIKEGDLLRRDDLDGYVFRLNRHPGRRVDVALSQGEHDEEVVVDYLVAEARPWSVYAQLSNTGTSSTNYWRERVGFVHNQLTGHDDILRLDYTTAGFDSSHAIIGSYDFPLLSDRIRSRVYASYTEFDASEVGQSGLDFSGQTYTAGAEVMGILFQHREFFLDALAGVRLKNEKVTTPFGEGDEVFWIPYVGVSAMRNTEASSTNAGVSLEFHPSGWGDTDEANAQQLGRTQVDIDWQVLKFNASHEFFLEPLLNPRGFKGHADSEGPKSLAHEIALSVRGQYGFSNRLLASEEEIAGGLFSVRGYPESVVAGDTVVIASAEYRFHVPRAFGTQQPGSFLGKPKHIFGEDFRWQPQQDFGAADWDWVLRAFVDAAKTRVNDKVAGEDDFTLVGAGIGTEIQWKRNFTMRLDWGFALQEVDDQSAPVDAGDNEVHFLVTVLY